VTALWPQVYAAWDCQECTVRQFLHCFTAVIDSVRRAPPEGWVSQANSAAERGASCKEPK
jgi:hypothetical protein